MGERDYLVSGFALGTDWRQARLRCILVELERSVKPSKSFQCSALDLRLGVVPLYFRIEKST